MKTICVIIAMLFFGCVCFGQQTDSLSFYINKLNAPDEEEQSYAILYIEEVLDNNTNLIKAKSKLLTSVLQQTLTSGKATFDQFYLLLRLSENKIVLPDAKMSDNIISRQGDLRRQLKPLQKADYRKWIWNDEVYMPLRYQSGVLLDLLGYTNAKAIPELLSTLAEMTDVRLKFFAATSLLRLGQHVSPDILNTIAREAEIRNFFYDNLVEQGKQNLYPAAYKSQLYFAESNMVNWLLYPTELGRTPDEITLVKIFTVDFPEEGPSDFYLWKFKTSDPIWKDSGWIAGMSGPFAKKKSPTTEALGYTFSALEPFNKRTPEKHFEHLLSLIKGYLDDND